MEATIQAREVFEYDEHNRATWTFQKLPDIPKDFERALVEIGGLNPHGKPNLRVVKGNEVLSDRSEHKRLKYHCGYTPSDVSGYRYEIDGETHFSTNIDDLDPSIMVFPAMEREELGLLRYVIEKWISPEELERQHRFSQRYGEGDLAPTLRTFPREGIYDTYLVIESAAGKFRKLDKDIIDFLKMQWKYDQMSPAEKEVERQKFLDKQEELKAKRQDELWQAAVNFDLKLDPEERERREHYWATKDDYEADLQRYKNTVAFYPNI